MFLTVAAMTESVSLLARVAGCAATETVAADGLGASSAAVWADQRKWDVAGTPGWAAKWEAGITNGITDPGAAAEVITEADVLGRVQQLLADFPIIPPPVAPPTTALELAPADVEPAPPKRGGRR